MPVGPAVAGSWADYRRQNIAVQQGTALLYLVGVETAAS